jgi:hypothetical protein
LLNSAPFHDGIKIIRWNGGEIFRETARPFDLQAFYYGLGAKAEVKPLVVRREVTAAASHLVDLNQLTCRNRNASSNGRTVALLAHKLEQNPVIG